MVFIKLVFQNKGSGLNLNPILTELNTVAGPQGHLVHNSNNHREKAFEMAPYVCFADIQNDLAKRKKKGV